LSNGRLALGFWDILEEQTRADDGTEREINVKA
jgi:hypothetical protein